MIKTTDRILPVAVDDDADGWGGDDLTDETGDEGEDEIEEFASPDDFLAPAAAVDADVPAPLAFFV